MLSQDVRSGDSEKGVLSSNIKSMSLMIHDNYCARMVGWLLCGIMVLVRGNSCFPKKACRHILWIPDWTATGWDAGNNHVIRFFPVLTFVESRLSGSSNVATQGALENQSDYVAAAKLAALGLLAGSALGLDEGRSLEGFLGLGQPKIPDRGSWQASEFMDFQVAVNLPSLG